MDDDGTPAWLKEASPSPPAAAAAAVATQAYAVSPTASSPYASAPVASTSSPKAIKEPDSQLKKYMLITRLANMGASILLCALGVLCLGTSPAFNTGVLAIYIFVFGVMLFCFELSLHAIARILAENLGFFYHAKGRLVFLVLIGILCFDMQPKVFGIVMGALIMAIAAFNFFMLFRFPEFEEYQRRKHLYGSYTGTPPTDGRA